MALTFLWQIHADTSHARPIRRTRKPVTVSALRRNLHFLQFIVELLYNTLYNNLDDKSKTDKNYSKFATSFFLQQVHIKSKSYTTNSRYQDVRQLVVNLTFRKKLTTNQNSVVWALALILSLVSVTICRQVIATDRRVPYLTKSIVIWQRQHRCGKTTQLVTCVRKVST